MAEQIKFYKKNICDLDNSTITNKSGTSCVSATVGNDLLKDLR